MSAGEQRPGAAPQRPKRVTLSVGVKLVLIFCPLFAAVLALILFTGFSGLPLTGFQGRIGQMKAEAFRGLELIADLKRSRLVNWLGERADDARQLAELDIVRFGAALLQPRRGIAPQPADPLLQGVLDSLLRSNTIYTKIRLAEAGSRLVVASTDPDDLGSSLAGRRFVEGALENRNGYLGGIEFSLTSNRPAFFVSHAVLDPMGALIAVIVLDIDAEDIIRPMLHIGDGLGERGEALLVAQDGRLLTSLKFPLPGGERPKPLDYRVNDHTALLAGAGEEGVGESVDYRGEPVLAAYRHVRLSSDEGWGLVVKRDESELLSGARREIAFTMLLGLGGLMLLTVLTVLASRRFTRPIRALDAAARDIAKGNTNVRAKVATDDEIGRLATAFNAMLDKLQNRRDELEAAVADRTKALDLANQTLRDKIADLEQAGEKIAAQLGEKEVLLREVHHRVKNNLQVISSLLSLQSVHVRDPRDKELFEDSVGRVMSMAMVHEDLYASNDFSKVGLRDYAGKLAGRLAAGLGRGEKVELKVDVQDIEMPIQQAIPCGLIINELLTNAYKHAFPSGGGGTIRLALHANADGYALRVADDGVGLAADFDWKKTPSLGLTLVATLTQQLHGEVALTRDGGADFTVKFPKQAL
jgi:two-component sensor histidine kinase